MNTTAEGNGASKPNNASASNRASKPNNASASNRASKPRNAAASKQALLEAAQMLFGQHGFEHTAVRDIGQRAGVDAALIKRYFGSKADLYVAAVVAESQQGIPRQDFESIDQVANFIVTRTDAYGPGPILQALIRSDTTPAVRTAARRHVLRRLVKPAATQFEQKGFENPLLRSEIVVAALFGINLIRALGWFEELRMLPQEDLLRLLPEILNDVDFAQVDDRE